MGLKVLGGEVAEGRNWLKTCQFPFCPQSKSKLLYLESKTLSPKPGSETCPVRSALIHLELKI